MKPLILKPVNEQIDHLRRNIPQFLGLPPDSTHTHSKIADEGSSLSVDSPPSWRQVGPQNAITDPLTEQ